jgi:hypothetical protein
MTTNDADVPSFCILEKRTIVSKEEGKAQLGSIGAIIKFSTDNSSSQRESTYSQRHSSLITQSTTSDESMGEFIQVILFSIINSAFEM